MTTPAEANRLRERIKELEGEVERLTDEIDRLRANCPLHNPETEAECDVVQEIDRLNQEVFKLRREMHDIAKRLAKHEDVTGRFFLPGFEDG